MKALETEEEASAMNDVWQTAADLEYALFLFSIMQQDEAQRSSWKLRLPSKNDEIKPLLVAAKAALDTAEQEIKKQNLLEAHKRTWEARGYLLRIHDFFEKKRKSGK